jgi:hypothetical protein
MFDCRVVCKLPKDEKRVEKLKDTDLTKFIKIKVTVLEENTVEESTGNSFDHLEMTVGILDKVSKLVDVYAKMSEKEGAFVLDGKIIKNPEDVTFYSQFAVEGSNFAMVCGGEKLGTPIMWKRFKLDYLDSYDYMSESSLDAVTFVP